MNVIDNVLAETLESGDLISHGGDEIEILTELYSDDESQVVFNTFNRNGGMVEPLSLAWDQRVDILGA